jgi:hypothetical protein
MIERMAKHKLEEEMAVVHRARRRGRTFARPRRSAARPPLALVS